MGYDDKMMDSNYSASDIKMKCVEIDCKKQFIFSVSDQEFFKKNKFASPARCLSCRKIRRLKKEQEEQARLAEEGFNELYK